MTFSWDFSPITVLAYGAQLIALIVYIVKTNGKANSAHRLAEKALSRADEAHEQIMLVHAQISLVREKLAGEHPTHDAIEQMETRLTSEIHSIRDRLDQFLDRRPTHR